MLQDLASGRREVEALTKPEMELLDRATIDFTRPAPKPEPPRPPPVQEKTPRRPARYPKPRIPELNGLEPYWWLD